MRIFNSFKKKHELFFFSPNKSEWKYENLFRKLFNDEYPIFSPLYILRREINRLSDSGLHEERPHKFYYVSDMSQYSALLLADIAIEGIVSNITATNKKDDDFDQFFKRFLDCDNSTRFLIRCLRNSLQHNFFKMSYSLREKEIGEFKKYIDKNKKKKIEISFIPVWNEPHDISPKGKYIYSVFGQSYWWKNYYVIHINCTEYFRRLNLAFKRLKFQILKDPILKVNFQKNINIRDWVPHEVEP